MEKPNPELLMAVQHLANAQALFKDSCHIHNCKKDKYSDDRDKFIDKYREYLPLSHKEIIIS